MLTLTQIEDYYRLICEIDLTYLTSDSEKIQYLGFGGFRQNSINKTPMWVYAVDTRTDLYYNIRAMKQANGIVEYEYYRDSAIKNIMWFEKHLPLNQ